MKTRTDTLLFACVLASFSGVARAADDAPTIGVETAIAPAAQPSQWRPAIAYDGKGTYLIVWRQGSGILGGDADILGARVSATGRVVDDEPIVIARAADFQKRPAVAWGDDHWLVVWQDARRFTEFGYDIYAARVDAAGQVRDPDGLVVCTEQRDQQMPAVASDGSRFLVVWADYRSNRDYDIFGSQIQGSSVSPPRSLLADAGEHASPAVAWTGTEYLLSSSFKYHASSDHGLVIRRVGRAGAPLGTAQKSGGSAPTYTSALAFAAGRGLALASAMIGKIYHPTHAYALLLQPDGTLAQPSNPGRPAFDDERVTRGAPYIRLSGTGMSPYVFSVATAASEAAFLTLFDMRTGFDEPTKSGVPRQAVRYALLRASDGRVLAEGELAKGMRAAVAGAAGGQFLVAYERQGPDHKILFRLVESKR